MIHIVFATKNRIPALTINKKPVFINYLLAIIRNLNCTNIELNTMPDHVHILVDLRPSISISDFVKNLKQSSSRWINRENIFPAFDKWQEGYFAGSIGPDGVERCRNYIRNQEKHHLGSNPLQEIEKIVKLYNLNWYPDDWI